VAKRIAAGRAGPFAKRFCGRGGGSAAGFGPSAVIFTFLTTMLRLFGFYLLAGLSGAAAVRADAAGGGVGLLQVSVGEPLANYVRQNGLDVKVDFFGTVPALTQLRQDKVQLAVIAAPVGEQPSTKEFTVLPYAYQVAYILVNTNNPITEVDRDQLIGVFGHGARRRNITSWSQLGLSGEWTSRSVLAVTTSSATGGAELFKHTILGGTGLKPSVQESASGSTSRRW